MSAITIRDHRSLQYRPATSGNTLFTNPHLHQEIFNVVLPLNALCLTMGRFREKTRQPEEHPPDVG